MIDDQAITIHDVASRAGVSVSTVSRILRNVSTHSYGEDTQQRVRTAAREMGYQPHAAARLLRQGKKTMAGLAVRLTVHPQLNHQLIAMRDELLVQGYEPVLFEPKQPAQDNRIKDKSSTSFPSPELLAGVLSLDLELERSQPRFYDHLRRRMPVVAIYDVASPGIEVVSVDAARGIEMAVGHLVELGHRRIGYTHSTSPHPSDQAKNRGWKRAVESSGFEARPEHLLPIHIEDSIFEMGAKTAYALAQLRRLDQAPTALVCGSDEVALSVMGHLGALGWKLPDDLSIIGFDGFHFGQYAYPPLTTILQPVEEIARAAVERLLYLMGQEENENEQASSARRRARQKFIAPSLLIRGSTLPCRK